MCYFTFLCNITVIYYYKYCRDLKNISVLLSLPYYPMMECVQLQEASQDHVDLLEWSIYTQVLIADLYLLIPLKKKKKDFICDIKIYLHIQFSSLHYFF